MLKFYDVYNNSQRWPQNNILCLSYLCTTLLLLVFPITISAQTHSGLTNPLNEGWIVNGSDNGTASPVVSDSDYPSINAWQINISPNSDSARARLRYEVVGPGPSESWTFQTRMRVVDPDSEYDSFDQLIEIANRGSRFILTFGSDNGNTEISPILQSEQDSGITAPPEIVISTATPGQTEYFNLAISYNATEGSADIFVNNVEVYSDFSGFTDTSNTLLQRVNFGDGTGTSNLTSNLRFAMVDYQTGVQACRDGIDNDGDGNVGFSGGDEDCLSSNDPTENAYCALGEDIDNDGYCEQVIGRNLADTDPSTSGWTANFSAPVVTSGVDNDPYADNCSGSCGFIEVRDGSTRNPSRGFFEHDISAGQYLNNLGWVYRSRLRLVPITDGAAEAVDFASTMFMQTAGGINKEYSLKFGITADRDLLVAAHNIANESNINIGSSDDYHHFEMVYNPDADVVDVLVDGELLLENYAGSPPVANENRVVWGSSANSGKKYTQFHEVSFEVAPDTDNDGIPDMEERRATNYPNSISATDPYKADTDDDGASDFEELVANSDPNNPDTDSDGLSDGFEIKFGFNPLVNDADVDAEPDGLTNTQEDIAGTDPTNPDSDGDGLSDGDEVNVHNTNPADFDSDNDGLNDFVEVTVHFTNPNFVDTDTDGISDGEEISNVPPLDPINNDTDGDDLLDGAEVNSYSTNPLAQDTDGDDLNDGFEVQFGLDPTVFNDKTVDTDGDGLDYEAEQNAGTDPTSLDSDNDGLNDDVEISLGSNPINSDTDGDGLTDGFESQFGLSINVAGDAILDTDSDGLTNLEEQVNGTDPTNNDSDNDGVVDGQEVNINNTNPLVSDNGVVTSSTSTALLFETNNNVLFELAPPTERIDLLGDELRQSIFESGTYGETHVIEGDIPLSSWQAAWDRGVGACRTERKIDDVLPLACKTSGKENSTGGDFYVTPTAQECASGIANISSRSIICCTVASTGAPDVNADGSSNDSIRNGCNDNILQADSATFTVSQANSDYGLGIKPTHDVGLSFPPRPTAAPPKTERQYEVGAIVDVSVDVTADLVLSAESSDQGSVDVNYQTTAEIKTNASSVVAGDVFRLSIEHTPSSQSQMKSTWSPIGLSAGYEINAAPSATATLYGFNPYKQVNYSGTTLPDFQETTVVNLFPGGSGAAFSDQGEFFSFLAGAENEVTLEFLTDVTGAPDALKNTSFSITPERINFFDDDVALNIPPGLPFDIIPPGTGLTANICWARFDTTLCTCPFPFIPDSFCFGLPVGGIGSDVASIRLQLPEVNTPVSETFNAGRAYNFFDAPTPASLLEELTPKRNKIETNGALINTASNGNRPLENYSGVENLEDLADALFTDQTNLSSDVYRFEWDIDGTFGSSGSEALFGVSAGLGSALELSASILDFDVIAWTGIDQSLVFNPNLMADISFDKDVEVRLVYADQTHPNHEDTSSILAKNAVKRVSASVANGNPGSDVWLEIIQPPGGVNINVEYTFAENVFENTTIRKTTIAPKVSILNASIGGLAGDAMSFAGVPTEFSAARLIPLSPPQIEVDISDTRSVDSGGNPDLIRHLPGIKTGASPSLFVAERSLDVDADGLPDSLEQSSCTSELDADTDNDGLGDGVEDTNRNGVVDAGETDPCDFDTDNDGLSDGFERGVVNPVLDPDGSGPSSGTDLAVFIANPNPIQRTNPLLIDTDGDGLTDGYEIANGLDPNDPSDAGDVAGDSDNDGLSNVDEISMYGTDTLNSDTDGDFVSDGDEVFVTITDPANTDAFAELYVTERDSDQVVRINSDGSRTLISGVGLGTGPVLDDPMGIVVEPNGTGSTDDSILVINMGSASLLRIDPATGDRTAVSDNTSGSGINFDVPIDLVLENANTVLVTDQGTIDRIFRVNLTTGNREVVVDGTSGIAPGYLALESSGSVVVAFQTSGDVRRYTIGIDGSLTEVALTTPILGVDELAGIAVQPDGRIATSSIDNVQLYDSDGTLVSNTGVPVTTPRGVLTPYSGGAIVSNGNEAAMNDSIGIVNFSDNSHSILSLNGDLPTIDYPEGLAIRSLIDSDFDGLGDIDEIARGLNPQSSDTDGDGLLDGDEFVIGSDANNVDSDDDGFSDFDEVNAGSNPKDAGSNPTDSDADGDGFVDTFDNCPMVANDQTDSDGDGIGDACEDDEGDGFTCMGLPANIVGTSAGELIIGTSGNDVIVGRGGADTIKGKGGNDVICGGSGPDVIYGGNGDDQLFGGKGADELSGGSGNDLLRGGRNSDTLNGNNGRDILRGGRGKDSLYGNRGNDILDGGRGNDHLFGGRGSDVLKGGRNYDVCNGGLGNTDTANSSCEETPQVP